jgi:hypothetical protein
VDFQPKHYQRSKQVDGKLLNNSGTDDVTFMRAWATHLASYLVTFGGHVQGLEIFGSLARGRGTINSDFDLILLGCPHITRQWNFIVHQRLYDNPEEDLYSESAAAIRRRSALEVIGIDMIDLENAVGIRPWKLDFFIFPAHWRKQLARLQQLGHHRDPRFMQNIAQDAIKFDPDRGFPFPTFPW